MKSSGETPTKSSSFFSPVKSNFKASSAKFKSLIWQRSLKEDPDRWQSVDNIKETSKTKSELWQSSVKDDTPNWKSLDNLKSPPSMSSSSSSSAMATSKSSKTLLWQNTIHEDSLSWQSMESLKITSPSKRKPLFWQKTLTHDAEWQSMDKMDSCTSVAGVYRNKLSKRRCSEPVAVVLGARSKRKPSLKSIQLMKTGSSTDVPSPSNSISYEDNELTEEQRKELRKAFKMFEKGGKNKMSARDLGALLRCLGWNPSERELEEAKHELVVSARGSVTFAEVERYVARRGGICYGCKDEEDIQEAFQVLDQGGDGKISLEKFKYFMTTLGEKMTDDEVDEMLMSLNKRKHTNFDSIEYTDLIEGLEGTTLKEKETS